MSIRVMTKVWEHSRMKGSALLLLLAISDFADDEGYAFPGTYTLSRKIRMSERQVIRLRQILYDSGELEYVSGGNGKGDKLSVRVTTRATKGDKSDSKGDKSGTQRVTRMSPEPSLDPPIEPSLEPKHEPVMVNPWDDDDKELKDSVFKLITNTYVSAFNNIRSSEQKDRFLSEHVALAERYGWEAYVRGFNAAVADEYRTGVKAEHIEHFILSKSKSKQTMGETIAGLKDGSIQLTEEQMESSRWIMEAMTE